MSESMKAAMVIRWILSVALVVEIWKHSHWSVALTMTLLCVNAEAEHWAK